MKSPLRRLGRIVIWLRTAWSVLGVTLVMVVLLEFGLRGIFWVKDRWKPQIPPDPRVVAVDPEGGAWLRVHYRELEALSDRWQPYVYFRQRPFPGKTVQVLSDGSRATWQPPSPGNDAGGNNACQIPGASAPKTVGPNKIPAVISPMTIG